MLIIGFANGCYDLFHEGHQHFLLEARRNCDYLVVAVNSDRYCREVKGPERPYDGLEKRMLHVRSIAQAAFPFEGRQDLLIMEIRPDIVFQGSDHGDGGRLKTMAVRRRGWKDAMALRPHDTMDIIPVHTIERIPGFSTSGEAARLAQERGAG